MADPDEPPDVASGLRNALAGRYSIEREIGRGGMAAVYLARDLRHDRPVAVKVLAREVVPANGAERFLREIRIAARLTHPHVLGVHDSGEADGFLYYVMPYVEGETLRAHLMKAGALPLPEAARLLRELAEALAHAHEKGIVHRDLKPENVLLSGGHAVVADFGIAKALDSATQGDRPAGSSFTTAGVVLGTPAYTAPEQVLNDLAIDHRADLYALGVIGYEVLAGGHPFGSVSPKALLAAHLARVPPPLSAQRPDVPVELENLIMQLLAKEPENRPASAGAVLHRLEGIPLVAAGGPKRLRTAALLGAAAILTLVGVGAWGIAASRSSNSSAESRLTGIAATSEIRTLAVLPFVNTDGDAGDEYFSDGLTDELAHALAKIPGLRIAGRTSSYAFKGKAVPAQEIGRTLDVRAFVTGTVRRAGDRIRVTAQLVSARDGIVVREAAFESRTGDVFAVQDELTRTIVGAIAPALGDRGSEAGGATPRGTRDQEAYDLYLKGRYHWLERGATNLTRSIEYFKQAIARDPMFARAHAGLALAYTVLPVYVPDPLDSALTLAGASAERALALDSSLTDAHSALGAQSESEGRLAEAEAHHRKAVALEPSNSGAHHWLGFLLLSLGRNEEALVELRQAVQLDPLAKSPAASYAAGLNAMRRFAEGEAEARRLLALDSTYSLGIQTLAVAQVFSGQPEEAVRTLERGLRLHPDAPGLRGMLTFAYGAAGRWSEAARVRAELSRSRGGLDQRAEIAFTDLVFGDREPLLRLLETRSKGRIPIVVGGTLGCNPFLDPLWDDPRFRSAMRRLSVAQCTLTRPWPIERPPGSSATEGVR